jgi:hypothetical protein
MTTFPRLYRLQVPIPNYYRDGIFEQDMFILSHKCPSKNQWFKLAKHYHERDYVYPEYTGDWTEVCQAIDDCKEFPSLYGNLVQTCTFVNTIFGVKPITIRIQEVHLNLGE